MSELKIMPCPFCDNDNLHVSENDYGESRWVECLDCECTGPVVLSDYYGDRKARAVELWNQRKRGKP